MGLCPAPVPPARGAASAVEVQRTLPQKSCRRYIRADQEREIYRRPAGVHVISRRITKGSARSNRSPRLPVCHHVDGKKHHRRKSSAICRDVFGGAVRGGDEKNR